MPHFKRFCHDKFATTVFCSHIQSLVELESVIVATAPDFEHTATLTYSLWLKVILTSRIKAMGEVAVQELNQISGLQNDVIYHQLDIGNRESILSLRKFIEESMEKWGFKVEGHLNPGLFNPRLQPQTFQP